MAGEERLTASLEDYLEAIWHLVREKNTARSKDIAERLGVNKSSVTGALKSLSARGLILYEAYQTATLTPEGKRTAEDIVRRHEVIRDFLERLLLLPGDVAEDNACRMEHALDGRVLERLVRFVEFTLICPRTKEGWVEGFRTACHRDLGEGSCQACVSRSLEALRAGLGQRDPGAPQGIALADLPLGEEARVVGIAPPDAIPPSLASQGLAVGALVEVEGRDASTGSTAVRVRGHHLTLDGAQAWAVKVRVLP